MGFSPWEIEERNTVLKAQRTLISYAVRRAFSTVSYGGIVKP
jgi:hypothetical protein